MSWAAFTWNDNTDLFKRKAGRQLIGVRYPWRVVELALPQKHLVDPKHACVCIMVTKPRRTSSCVMASTSTDRHIDNERTSCSAHVYMMNTAPYTTHRGWFQAPLRW